MLASKVCGSVFGLSRIDDTETYVPADLAEHVGVLVLGTDRVDDPEDGTPADAREEPLARSRLITTTTAATVHPARSRGERAVANPDRVNMK